MAFSNITRIILYVVDGISLLVVLLFYVSPKTIDMDALAARVDEIMNPVDLTPVAPLPAVQDSTSSDSTAVAETAVEEEEPESTAFAAADVIDTSGTNLKEHLNLLKYLNLSFLW